MSAEFAGARVGIVLKAPTVVKGQSSSSLIGRIAQILEGRLYLRDVKFLVPSSGDSVRLPSFTLHGEEIQDLELLPATAPSIVPQQPTSQTIPPPASTLPAAVSNARPSLPPSAATLRFVPASVVRPAAAPQPATAPQPVANIPTASSTTFVDPAILTYARSPATVSNNAPPYPQPNVRAAAARMPSEPQIEALPAANVLPPTLALHEHSTVPHTHTFDYLVVDNNTQEVDQEEVEVISAESRRPSKVDEVVEPVQSQMPSIAPKKKGRTRQKPKSVEVEAIPPSSPEIPRTQPLAKNGWRQTPIIVQETKEPANTHLLAPPQNAKSKRKQTNKLRKRERDLFEAQSGWATEDATDVQDMGEFDFAENLSKFDKKAVFEQLAEEDDIPLEDRLVSHNRLAKPGTFGGTKLHPTENVLDGDDQDGEASEHEYLALAASTASVRARPTQPRAASRKSSRLTGDGYASPSSVSGTLGRSHRSMSLIKSPNHVSFDSDSRVASPATVPSAGTRGLRYVNSSRSCPVMTPEALDDIEALAETEFAMSQDLLTENAGRTIASAVLMTINPGGQRLSSSNHNTRPVIVVLAGAHNNGARAIAAARHLAERGVRIIISSPHPQASQHPSLQAQAQRLGGSRPVIRAWKDTAAYLKTLDAPPELIIDALSDRHSSPFSTSAEDGATDGAEDIDDAQETLPTAITTAISMMEWANRSSASVLSLDVPSGVSSHTGQVAIRAGEPAEVRARIVLCLGAPTVGLVRAMKLRQASMEEVGAEGIGSGVVWKVFVGDCGLGGAGRRWIEKEKETNREASGGKARWVQFGGEWVIGVELAKGATAGAVAEGAGAGLGLGLALERRTSRKSLVAAEMPHDAYE